MISSEANAGPEAILSEAGESRSRTVSSSARRSSSAILVSEEEEDAMATKTTSNGKMTKSPKAPRRNRVI